MTEDIFNSTKVPFDVNLRNLTNLTTSETGCDAEVNSTLGPPINYEFYQRISIIVLLVIIMLATVIGNSLVITSVIRYRKLRTLPNHFVLSLAVADVLVAIFVMPFGAYNIYTNMKWNLGQFMCKVSSALDVMLTTSSILHLSCLATDRYYAICSPFFYHEKITKKTVIVLLTMCWTIPIIISWIPIMAEWNAIGISDIITCRSAKDGQSCVFLVNIPFALSGSLIAFYAPTIFMLAVNIRIYNEAKKQAEQIRSYEMATLDNQTKDKNMLYERKAAKMLSVIMGLFCCCWFPFFLFNILDPLLGYSIPFTAWQLALWLGYINSTVNPSLYYIFNKRFRTAFRNILCCKCFSQTNNSNAMYETALSNQSY